MSSSFISKLKSNNNPNPQHTEENNSKKKKESKVKANKNDDANWDEEEYPQIGVNVKNISEIKQKKQEPNNKGIHLS